MKNKFFKPLLAMACLLSSINVSAYDFEVDGIYYDVVSLSEFTCKVVKKSANYEYSGDVVIPAHVNYANKTLTVVGIEDELFRHCSELTGITIPNTITRIGDHMFSYCSGLTSVTIPNSVTKIGGFAFENCSGLTSVTIPNSVTEIGDNVFAGCGITSITLPSSIKRIGEFGETDNITTIYILNPTPPSVGGSYYEPFTNNQYMTLNVYVPQGSLEAYQNADVWKNFWNLQEGAPTGIDNVKNITPNVNNHYYDLRGNRLGAPKRGLNIINGKKVIVK